MTRPGNSNINGGKNREPHHDCEVGAKIINPLLSASVARQDYLQHRVWLDRYRRVVYNRLI